jgi:hypothetical protein
LPAANGVKPQKHGRSLAYHKLAKIFRRMNDKKQKNRAQEKQRKNNKE